MKKKKLCHNKDLYSHSAGLCLQIYMVDQPGFEPLFSSYKISLWQNILEHNHLQQNLQVRVSADLFKTHGFDPIKIFF